MKSVLMKGVPVVSMQSLPKDYRAIVFGSTGGIGGAFVHALRQDPQCGEVVGLCRTSKPGFDLVDETTIAAAAESLPGEFHLMVDATGFLSDDRVMPEKSLRSLDADNLVKLYTLNAIGPALLIKHFSSKMPRTERGIFATLSARVGSIGDNRLGGWYAYRAAKAALNMLVKSAAIEIARNKPQSVLAALHPGTVATSLSDPFAGNRDRLKPAESATKLLAVLDAIGPEKSGHLWDYLGEQLEW
ncbi:MAG: SDR family NAD(P)-dependent oxidoreductase [Pseudomonadota bacterium]